MKIKTKDYKLLDGSTQSLIQQVGCGDIIKRFEKTPFPENPEDIVCPHFLELKWAWGCPFSCSWCYLQGTFRWPKFEKLKDRSHIKPKTKDFFKVCRALNTLLRECKQPALLNSGELSDSLIRDKYSIFDVITYFKNWNENVKVLLLTKSTNIEPLLNLNLQDRVVVSFSLNSDAVAETWERGTPNVIDRIKAAEKLMDAKYIVRLRIDPIVPVPPHRLDEYIALLEMLFEGGYDWDRITLGSLRGLQSTISAASDKSWVKYLGEDTPWGKRVPFEKRLEMYNVVITRLLRFEDYDKVALCKEQVKMWDALELDYKKIKCNCTW